MEYYIGPDLRPRDVGAPAGSLYRVAPTAASLASLRIASALPNTMVRLDDGRIVTADTLANELNFKCMIPPASSAAGRASGITGCS